jgi:hypothetical protein
MSDWPWKQAVADRVLQIVNEKSSSDFSIKELYAYTKDFSALFPRNLHVREKIRHVLQRLRDEGFLQFHGGGTYSLNLANRELEGDPASLDGRGVEFPRTKQVVRNIRLRSTLLGAEIKRRYNNNCQICRVPVPLWKGQYYAEAHHLWPIGSPHFGPDVPGNIIVLCPNHHSMFDRGVVTILPDKLLVRHIIEGIFPKRKTIYLESWHSLSHRHLEYHHAKIFGKLMPAVFD